VVSLSLCKEKTFFDEKIATLLMLVNETESVRKACQRMQISYSVAWDIIHTLESQLQQPLVLRTQGGPKGSTSVLSEEGKLLLARFVEYQQAIREHANSLYETYFGGVF
jgi:molybdate transport repressor ModE-like protein